MIEATLFFMLIASINFFFFGSNHTLRLQSIIASITKNVHNHHLGENSMT